MACLRPCALGTDMSSCKYLQFWLGNGPMVVVSDPDAARKIATRFLNRPDLSMMNMLEGEHQAIMNAGLLTARWVWPRVAATDLMPSTVQYLAALASIHAVRRSLDK